MCNSECLTDGLRVFISYVRENQEEVDRLCDELTQHGVRVWLDRNDITPGTRWRQAIRRAIHDGAFFIACFSKEYNERDENYMNEELVLAIERLRKLSTDRSRFFRNSFKNRFRAIAISHPLAEPTLSKR